MRGRYCGPARLPRGRIIGIHQALSRLKWSAAIGGDNIHRRLSIGQRRVRGKDLRDLERVDVNVEGMRDEGRIVRYSPLFNII